MATAKGKNAAKAAPVAAQAEVETAAEFEVGQSVKFLGYAEGTPEEEMFLEAGAVYEVVGISEADADNEGGHPIVSVPNPEFNAKKKEHPDTNPKNLELEVFAEEVELVDGDEPETVEEQAEEVAEEAPAAPAKGKGKAAAAAPAKGKAAAVAAAPAKGKGKAAAAAPAKGKGKAVAKVEEAPKEDPDALPELEGEDEEVLALIEGSEDLIATAQELEAAVGTTEYQLGGILYHIKKAKTHLNVEGGAEYAEKGGFQKFLTEYFNIDYRKAMYLIEIYVNFTLAQIENPAEKVANIGWTKASKIAKLLVAEGANPDELVELASQNSVADLSEAIKEQVQVGGTKGEKGETVTRLTLKFRFFEEEAKTVDSVLAAAQEQLGLVDKGDALLRIVTEWAAANAGGTATAASAPKQTAAKATAKPAAVAKPAAKRAAVKA